jgi:thiamine-monophosphate kinase
LPLNEIDLIERIKRLAGGRSSRALVQGIGDDCAVLKVSSGHELLVTTDLCVENVHFRRAWHPAASVGHRCLARGLSDIAAMGGVPLACFLSLALPPSLPQSWVDGFLDGFIKLARRFRVLLAGGDIASAREIAADIVVAGQAPSGRALLRSGARPGDRIYVTGALGGSAAVLERLFAGERVRAASSRQYFYPEPRLEAGRRLRMRRLASAMIDISDGLSVDLAHICQESRVGAVIDAAKLPVDLRAELKHALHGGDDYELLFTAPAKIAVPATIAGVPITEIGAIIRRKDYSAAITILGDNGRAQALKPLGWQHFRRQTGK